MGAVVAIVIVWGLVSYLAWAAHYDKWPYGADHEE